MDIIKNEVWLTKINIKKGDIKMDITKNGVWLKMSEMTENKEMEEVFITKTMLNAIIKLIRDKNKKEKNPEQKSEE